MCCTARRSVSSRARHTMSKTNVSMRRVLQCRQRPALEVPRLSSGPHGFTSQVGFGYVDNHFGKHSSSPMSLQELGRKAARRALEWLNKSGLLPYYSLDHGLAGSTGYSHHNSTQSVFETASGCQDQIPATVNHGLASGSGAG